jgi:dihydropteroate synthase
MFKKKLSINCNGNLIDLSVPKIMGILNITPDSFFDGGKYLSTEKALNQINLMIKEGADFIDTGAVSSRPGSKLISFEEEKSRLESIFKLLSKEFPKTIFSIDTFRSEIANYFVNEYNVGIVNDISAGELDSNMFETIKKLNVPYIIMHMQGIPENMQNNPNYINITQDIIKYFANKISELNKIGVNDVIIDPGFGFGKTKENNYEILKNLKDFEIFDLPLLAGISRKSMIYNVVETTPEMALNGTIAANTIALMNGANILRVHDVKAAKDGIKIVSQILEN